MISQKIVRLLNYCMPPIWYKVMSKAYEISLPKLTGDLKDINLSGQALKKLLKDYEFETVLDIGSGAGKHAKIFSENQKSVTALDFGTSIYAEQKGSNYENVKYVEVDFLSYDPGQKFDCVWASHVLEHQADPGTFIKKCMKLTREDGIISITVPPMEDYVLGGHLTNWNAGLLIYHLVLNGLDCSQCSILSYGYNISVLVKNNRRADVDLSFDNGDITKLLKYFPACITSEPFNGRIRRWNW